jgi:hypothetical protein
MIGVVPLLLFGMFVGHALCEIPRPLSDTDASYVPSAHNETELAEMQCTACLSASLELLRKLRQVRREFQREPKKLKEYHLLSALEDVCDVNQLNMGLIRDGATKRVTTTFGNDASEQIKNKFAVVKGAWITHLWRQQCLETMDRLEDSLREIYNADGANFNFCPSCEAIDRDGTLDLSENEEL